MGSFSAQSSSPLRLRPICLTMSALLLVSIFVMVGLFKLDDLLHLHLHLPLPQSSTPTATTSTSSAKLGLDLFLQQEVREGLKKLSHELDAMKAQMEKESNQTSADLALVKKLLPTSMLMQTLDQGKSSTSTITMDGLTDEGEERVTVGLDTSKFRPLYASPRRTSTSSDDDHVYHRFLSLYRGRGWAEGPPELFVFPSLQDPISRGRLLCIRGNSTSHGPENHYTFAHPDALPSAATLVPGTTLLSDTSYDFVNPWHSMYNLFQFIFWRIDSSSSPLACPTPSNLLLFHRGEYRTRLGPWITNLFRTVGLPTSVFPLDEHATHCFRHAIVSRSGLGGMRAPMRRRIFNEARCRARASCNVFVPPRLGHDVSSRHVNITLILRTNGRSFEDEDAWMRVIESQCQKAGNCSWSTMRVANLTFCEQVKAISYSDILISAHGAQLTNMIFMSLGGRVMEMFPGGWLELAGHGQFIYKQLANWVGLRHEGYWRDPSTPACPNSTDSRACFHHYKDQSIGINETYVGDWLATIIIDFKSTLASTSPILDRSANSCECMN